jgi:hypothetical protein
MFRTVVAFAIVFASGGAAVATPFSAGYGIQGHVQNPADPAARATQEHLRSQLDWRSYYLNRIGGRHARQSQFRDMAAGPRGPKMK